MPPEKWQVSHLSVFARATLMLRLASGSALDLLKASGIGSIDFWSTGIGKARGMWDSASPASVLDLWTDIQPSLQEVDTFLNAHAKNAQTFHRVEKDLGAAANSMGCCERIALWGMARI